MTTIVDFLERVGKDPELRHATAAELDQALTGIGIDPELRAAIAHGDQARLESLLGAATNVCCGLHTPDDEDEEDAEEDDDEEQNEDVASGGGACLNVASLR